MSKIILARLEARIYVWLSGLNLSTKPKEIREKLFEASCHKKIKEIYPKASSREIKETTKHLKEYWIEVFKREL